MKEKVTDFDLEAAFAELDTITIPAVRGIKANRVSMKESFNTAKLKTDLLLEDYYDVNDSADMDQAAGDRQEDVAQAKLSRIEKIVDLDAETAADVEGSYVGRNIVRCPQCMTLFYRKPEDLVADENDPKTVNVGEECPNCGNTTGYELVGKVAEAEPEAQPAAEAPAEEAPAEEQPAEEANAEQPAEEQPAEEAAPAEDNTLDLDLDLDLEAPAEEEKKEESLHRSEANEPVEKKHLSDNDSKNLTLNEDVDNDEEEDPAAASRYNMKDGTVGDKHEPIKEELGDDAIKLDLSDGGNVGTIKINAADEELAHKVDEEASRRYDKAQEELADIFSEEDAARANLEFEYSASGYDFFVQVADEMGLEFEDIWTADDEAEMQADMKLNRDAADELAHPWYESCNKGLCESASDLDLLPRDEWTYGRNGNQINGFISEVIGDELDKNADIAYLGIAKDTSPEDPEVCVHFLDKDKKELFKKCYKQDETNVLHESADENKALNKKLAEHDAYIKYLQSQISAKEAAVKSEKNEFIKNSIQGELDALYAALDTAVPEEVKNSAATEEAPVEDAPEVPEEAPLEDIPAEEPAAEENPTEANDAAVAAEAEKTESLHENNLNKGKYNGFDLYGDEDGFYASKNGKEYTDKDGNFFKTVEDLKKYLDTINESLHEGLDADTTYITYQDPSTGELDVCYIGDNLKKAVKEYKALVRSANKYGADSETFISVSYIKKADVDTLLAGKKWSDDYNSDHWLALEIKSGTGQQKIYDKLGDDFVDNYTFEGGGDEYESLNRSKQNAPVEKKHLSDNDSENLTLNEDQNLDEAVSWKVITDADGDNDVDKFQTEQKARAYYDSLVKEVKDDPKKFGRGYILQLWHGNKVVDEFNSSSLNEDLKLDEANIDPNFQNDPAGMDRLLRALNFGQTDDEKRLDPKSMTFNEKKLIEDGCYYLSHNHVTFAANRAVADAILNAWNSDPKLAKKGEAYIERDEGEDGYWLFIKDKEADYEKGLIDPYADKEEAQDDVEESVNNPVVDKPIKSENKPENKSLNEDNLDADIAKAMDTDEFKKPVSDAEVEKALKVEDLEEVDDEAVEECISEALTAVYENVKDFKLENCLIKEGKLIFEGKINFKSGNSKPTTYAFTEAVKQKDGKVVLNGMNEGLDKNGKFTLNASVKDGKALCAESMKYSYHVGKDLVEGLANKH